MRAVPQPLRPQSSSSQHVAPDFTALASPEPGTRVAAHFLSFVNGVCRLVYAQDIALPYHREDIPVVCGAPATGFQPQAREWTVAVAVVNRDIFYPFSRRPESSGRPTKQFFRIDGPVIGIGRTLADAATTVRNDLPAIFPFRVIRRRLHDLFTYECRSPQPASR